MQFPTGLFTPYMGEYGKNIITARPLARIAAHGVSPDGAGGWGMLEDFRVFGDTYALASNVGRYASESACWRSYQDTGDTIAQLATERNGVIRIATTTTDNNESWLQPGNGSSVLGVVDTTAPAPKMFGFGYRVRFTQVTDTYNAFLGAAEEGTAIADILHDTAGALKTTADFLGFNVAEGDGDSLTFKFQKASQTPVTVLTYGTALAAATWMNLEFLYDADQPTAKKGTIYIDGVEQASYVTGTQMAAATFPLGEELNLLMGIKNQTNVGKSIDIDGCWAYCSVA